MDPKQLELCILHYLMRISVRLMSGAVAALGVASLYAQVPAPAPKSVVLKNLINNGSFESSIRRDSLWYGVDNAGFLCGERGMAPVLLQSGSIGEASMPLSVCVADMNDDKLLDLVTLDVIGYMRIFFNSGTAEEPKFSVGELAGIFLSRTSANDPVLEGAKGAAGYARRSGRVFAGDFLKTGKNDLIIGNYIGEVLLVPNVGSSQIPDFRPPPNIERAAIQTTKDAAKKWGNVFAPFAWDWNNDGRCDLILGEGSYSANNIHLLINQGSGSKPLFDELNRHVIAFGDGLEQLTPTVVDYNDDNKPDLLVSERSGKIAVYLNSGETAKLGEAPPELPFASFIGGAGGGTPLSFGGISTVSTGDLNGDGLFDLVIGKSNGHVAMGFNIGTKTEPRFAAPVELKGEAVAPPFAIPSAWEVDYGLGRGNFYGFFGTVGGEEDKDAQPPEGKFVLKAGYYASPNKILATPSVYPASLGDWKPGPGQSPISIAGAPARYFHLRQRGSIRFKLNGNYVVSFKVKGKFSDGMAAVSWGASKELSAARVVDLGDRGAAEVRRNIAAEGKFEDIKFSGGVSWVEVRKSFKAELRHKELQDVKEISGSLELSFILPDGGAAYFDDFKIVETP